MSGRLPHSQRHLQAMRSRVISAYLRDAAASATEHTSCDSIARCLDPVIGGRAAIALQVVTMVYIGRASTIFTLVSSHSAGESAKGREGSEAELRRLPLDSAQLLVPPLRTHLRPRAAS